MNEQYGSGSMMATRRLVLGGMAASVLSACGGGEAEDGRNVPLPRFIQDGLSGSTINRFSSTHAGLFAVGSTGLHLRVNGAWAYKGLADYTVHDVVVIPDDGTVPGQRWLASVSGPAASDGLLMSSRDAGASWQVQRNDFGGAGGGEIIRGLLHDVNRGRTYATGAGSLAVSVDGGRKWSLIAGQWGAIGGPLLALELIASTGELIVGGQNGINRPIIFKASSSTAREEQLLTSLSSPGSVTAIRRLTAEGQSLLLAGSGGLLASSDAGGQWKPMLLLPGIEFTDVQADPRNPALLVASVLVQGESAASLRFSRDSGVSWIPLAWSNGGTINCLRPVVENGMTVFYVGQRGRGVARLTGLL